MRQEVLATDEEVDEIASRAAYDERDEAHIAVTHAFSIGTATVWLKVHRVRTRVLACASIISMLIDIESILQFNHILRRPYLC